MWPLPLWVVLGLTAAVYAGAPNAGFFWDDRAIVLENRVLDAPTFEEVFLRDLWCCTSGPTTPYHRPALTLTFLLDRQLFGRDPAGPHVHNLLWHLLAVTLVAVALRRHVGVGRANVAALIFGVHPIQSEAVFWIAARNDLMAAAGVLATLALVDRLDDAPPRRAAGLRLAVAAVVALTAMSKDNAVLLPLLVPLWRAAWGARVRAADLAAVAVGLGASLALRAQATLGGHPLAASEISVNATSALYAVVTVLGWVTLPWPLTTTASLYMPEPRPGAWAAAVATLALIGGLVWVGRVRAAILLLFAAVVLAPTALAVRWYALIGERYLYLPMFGVVAAIAAATPASRAWLPVGAGLVLASLLAVAVRAPDWATEEAVWTAAARRAPDGYSLGHLGSELSRQGRVVEATAVLDAAVRVRPVFTRACPRVAEGGQAFLPDDLLAERLALWAEPCGGIGGFDGVRALALARRGRWDEAREVADTAVRNDVPKRRDQLVRVALARRDGDLLEAPRAAQDWPAGPQDLYVQVAELLLSRSDPAD